MAWWPARLVDAWTHRDRRAHKSMCGRHDALAYALTYPLKGPGAWFTPWLPPCRVLRLWPCFRRHVRVCGGRERAKVSGVLMHRAPWGRGVEETRPHETTAVRQRAECRRRSVCLARACLGVDAQESTLGVGQGESSGGEGRRNDSSQEGLVRPQAPPQGATACESSGRWFAQRNEIKSRQFKLLAPLLYMVWRASKQSFFSSRSF